MIPFGELIRILWESTVQIVTEPVTLVPLLLVLVLIWFQYRRIAALERSLFGAVLNRPERQIGLSLGAGLVGGVLATVIFLLMGISLPEAGILYVWLLALLLMLIHPRFICFSYSGGIVALASLLFGVPDVNVGGLMALVAVLHLVEAILIRLTGAEQPTPVYVRHVDGRVVGGFLLQKFWPAPFFALLALVAPEELLGAPGTVAMPDWWPLIGYSGDAPAGSGLVYTLFPVAAALGYGDIAITKAPQEKARFTSNRLLIYSLALLLLAVLATKYRLFAFAAALFSPLAHEMVIWAGRRSERIGRPLYTNQRGPTVMATVPDSPADRMGLMPGDVICSVNGCPVRSSEEILAALSPWALEVQMLVERQDRTQHILRYRGKVPPLGLVLAPDGWTRGVVQLGGMGPLGRWLVRLRRKSAVKG